MGHLPTGFSTRAEVNRVLEFSRTVGLCNYPSSSRRLHGSASRTSDIDSESRVGATSTIPTLTHRGYWQLGSPRPRNSYGSPISEFSEREHFGAPLDGIVPCSGATDPNYTKFEADCSPVGHLETAGAGSSHFGSIRRPAFSSARRNRERDSEFTEPASEYGYPPTVHHTPQQDSQPIDTLGPQISRNSFSSGFSVRKLCAMNPFTPSFDALEFPTSPLPPSSPLPSSTVHGSLLSLCPVPHLNEGTHLEFDTTPARGSCGVDSSSRSSYCRPMTLDSASESLPVRHLFYSRGIHKVPTPHFMPSSSKADIILELLARDHPWNAIGDMLGLPPIPTANETYLKEIASHRTVSHELVSPQASTDESCAESRSLGTSRWHVS